MSSKVGYTVAKEVAALGSRRKNAELDYTSFSHTLSLLSSILAFLAPHINVQGSTPHLGDLNASRTEPSFQ